MPEQHRTWLSLLVFCLVRVVGAALILAVVLVSGTLTFASGQSPKARRTFRSQGTSGQVFSGVVTDSDCGARHDKDAGMSSAECSRACVRNGAKYVLVDGEKKYALNGNPAELAKAAGQRVKISGTLTGETLQVNSINPQ